MLDKILEFLARCVVYGIAAIFFSAALWIILAIGFAFLMIPVSIIAGKELAGIVWNLASDFSFRIIYAIVFVWMVVGDYRGARIRIDGGRPRR